MGVIALLIGFVVVMMGVVGIGTAVVALLQRTRQIDGPAATRAQLAENEELRAQVDALQTQVDRLVERVDFTEKLLEKPREE